MRWPTVVRRSLRYYARTGVVAAVGLAVATAVITGSLVIGDSMTGSLRDTALSRLGLIDCAVVSPRWFRAALAAEVAGDQDGSARLGHACALIRLPAAAGRADTAAVAPDATAWGVDAGFWALYPRSPAPALRGRECAVNAPLARDLALRVGDDLLLVVQRAGTGSADTLFARRSLKHSTPSLRLTVKLILPATGAGDIRLDAQSTTPRNVFLARSWLAERISQPGLANTILASLAPDRGRRGSREPGEAPAADRRGVPGGLSANMDRALAAHCTLADYGLRLTPSRVQAAAILQSTDLVLDAAQVAAARQAALDCRTRATISSVYLATELRRLTPAPGKALAYATVAGVEPPGRFRFVVGRPATQPSDIVLSSWAAADLGARVGDALQLSYLRPTADGTYPRATVRFRVRGIVAIAGQAADPGIVPELEGVSTARRIGDWDPPFPVDFSRITARDEAYWARYRALPKAFLSPDAVRAMWAHGPRQAAADWVTAVCVTPPRGSPVRSFTAAYGADLLRRLSPAASGLAFRPVREQALAAARGTSDFSQLFLGLSMFLVMSGAGLSAMLLRTAMEQRAAQAGIMRACGLPPALVSRSLFIEGALYTVGGALLGVPLGLGYAGAIIDALGTHWSGAVGAMPAVWLHTEPATLTRGLLAGSLLGLLTVAGSLRRLGQRPVLALLTGWEALSVAVPTPRRRHLAVLVLAVLTLGAVCLALVPARVPSVTPQAAFFGVGALLLVAGLVAARVVASHVLTRRHATRSLLSLALRNVAAAGGRSMLVMGLLAAASFVIVAVATNARDLRRIDANRRDSGTGGFSLVATTAVALPFDPATPAGRANLAFSPEDEAALRDTEVISLLAAPGEDISCLNLARASHPRLVGVPPALIRRGGFSPITRPSPPGRSPWELLTAAPGDGTIPAFGDADSVRWSLHSGLGQTLRVPTPDGGTAALRVTGLLPASIFQRELLVSEGALRRLYPTITAPSYLLLATPPGREQAVAEVFRRNLGPLGLRVRPTPEVLTEFLQVQNTYLLMFLALGGLGLLLGTVGLATVMLRSALERRRELALMLAAGFARGRIAAVLLTENALLLLAGLLCGMGSALVAVGPQLLSTEAHVNWAALSSVLGACVVVGLLTCAAAVRIAMRGDLVPALRHE